MKLANKVALITGAGQGMGLAGALLFAAEGAAVAAVDVNEATAAETAKRIQNQGGRAIGIRADVAQAADVQQMFARTVKEFGRLNVVYNNAAIIEENTQLGEFDDEVFDRVIAVNLRGVYLGMKYALPHLIAAGGGHTLRTSLLLTFGSAAGANAVNNLPMTTFMVRAIAEAPVLAGHARQAAIWGTLVGDAIGPNLTLLGSLATMLWLVLLRDRGLDVRAWDYIRVGLIVTPAMLLAAALLLTVTVSWR